MTDDGLEIEESGAGFKWVYQSPGGACFIAPKVYKTKAAARKAGLAWVTEREEADAGST
jgi:hypothetical protein